MTIGGHSRDSVPTFVSSGSHLIPPVVPPHPAEGRPLRGGVTRGETGKGGGMEGFGLGLG